jgi:asparagine synthase (glutamine-hydrolysing)
LERSFQDEKVVFSHERLAIVDPTSGKQPLFTKDGKVVLAVNGEIYNHRELKEEFPDYEFQTQSDCEVILALYRKYGKDFVEKLNGILHLLYTTQKMMYISLPVITWESALFIRAGIKTETIM